MVSEDAAATSAGKRNLRIKVRSFFNAVVSANQVPSWAHVQDIFAGEVGGKTFEKPGFNVTPLGAVFNWQIVAWLVEAGSPPTLHVTNWVGPILPYP